MGKPAFLYRTYLPTATALATDSHAGTSPGDVLGSTEDVFWRPLNTAGEKILTFNFDEALNINGVGIVGAGLDGVTITVEGSADAAFTTPIALATGINLDGAVNAAWTPWAGAPYQHVRIKFTTFGDDFRVAHVIFPFYSDAPFLEEDWTPDRIDETGKVLESAGGLFLGANQIKTMRKLPLNFGDVDSVEFAILRDWAKNCIETLNPFVFVPDVDETQCFYGWLDKPSFSAPFVNGMYHIEALTMRTRAK